MASYPDQDGLNLRGLPQSLTLVQGVVETGGWAPLVRTPDGRLIGPVAIATPPAGVTCPDGPVHTPAPQPGALVAVLTTPGDTMGGLAGVAWPIKGHGMVA